MAQVQCPNCGGFIVEAERADSDPQTGRKVGRGSCVIWVVASVVATAVGLGMFQLVVTPLLPRAGMTTAAFLSLGSVVLTGAVFYVVLMFGVKAQRARLAGAVTTYHYRCHICGYSWSWRQGDPLPAVTVRPDLIAQGSEKLRAGYCQVCGQPVPENVRTCSYCGTARW